MKLDDKVSQGGDLIMPPSLAVRIFAVWYRHVRVYTKNLVSNGLPPFLEPLIFLTGIGLGLGKYIPQMGGASYVRFLAAGLFVSTAMMTAAFECSFGTFIRMEFNKVYDGMLAAPISVENLLVGEILWAATKGFFFSFAVLCIVVVFGIMPVSYTVLVPFVGLLTGMMFGSLSLLVTSYVKTINYFNFYFTGFLSPMFFFSGVVFPIENLPEPLIVLAYALPLTHAVRLSRALCLSSFTPDLLLDVAYILAFTVIVGYLAVSRLRHRLLD
ncbi:MAG: ABC transporter permease [Nitrospirae bacterium]|nr:ABC transporter permease [Nitrospirota bacterium]MBF0591529.1 ABC transporter permease [Nitrospirota bacterium]